MTLRSRLALAVSVAAAAAAPAASAQQAPVLLPSVRAALTPGPPLQGSTTATGETFVPQGTTSDERVHVGIDAAGRPVAVSVVQRLRLNKLGDYTFAVPGPIADVEGAAGTESEPGLRKDAIVWAGFSSGHRTLGARATLRVPGASPSLPLRMDVTRVGDTLVVHGENVTGAKGPVLYGPVVAPSVVAALDSTRRTLSLGNAAPDEFAQVTRSPQSQSELIYSPLEVEVRAGPRTATYMLGDGRRQTFELRVPNASPQAKVRVVATPVPPTRLLTPPGGAATWADAFRRGLVDRASLLERASRARLGVARVLQYDQFLANPDPRGRAKAVYVYETVKRQGAVATANKRTSSNETLRVVLVALLGTLAAGAVVVLWAHS